MERVRIEEFGEFKDEDYGFGQGFSLKILSGNSLHFVGIRIFIVGCMRNAKSQFQPNKAFWRLNLRTRTSRELTVWPDWKLSCSALAVVNLQLPYMLHMCATFDDLPIARSSCETLLECTHLEFSSHFLTHYPYIIPT